jgi:hypothetical protein
MIMWRSIDALAITDDEPSVITERQTYDAAELLWNRRLLDEPWLSQRDKLMI